MRTKRTDELVALLRAADATINSLKMIENQLLYHAGWRPVTDRYWTWGESITNRDRALAACRDYVDNLRMTESDTE